MHTALWVFGYGSLIWDPGFPVAERRIATAKGWHRSFCMRSIHHRGTVDCPGLVLALDRAAAASCTGVAFRVQPGHEPATLAALRERELISSAYLELTLPVSTPEPSRSCPRLALLRASASAFTFTATAALVASISFW